MIRLFLIFALCLFPLRLLAGGMAAERTSRRFEEGKKHWAYQPVTNPPVPSVQNSSWPLTAVDKFVLATLEKAGVQPALDATPETLIRRIYFDLIGLPPEPAEIDEFLRDPSESALQRIVDRLLARPQFGERWGRHWLDVARFAESVTLRGLIFDEAWRYRDYVVGSFNRDLPFDEFLREQIAGDLTTATNLEERVRNRIATTFLVLGNFNYEEQDKEQLRMDIIDEQLDTIGKAFLGQTIGCARCHNHKFDPISSEDYYGMAGILRNTRSVQHANVSTWLELPLPVTPEMEQEIESNERHIAEVQRQIRRTMDRLGQKPAKKVSTPVEDLTGIVIDDSRAKKVGEWQNSEFNKPFVGDGYIHDQNAGKGSKTVTFQPDQIEPGKYEVRFAYTSGNNRAGNVPVTVLHAGGESTLAINEKVPPPIDGHFVSLGQFVFEQANQASVLVSTAGTDGHVIVDAVQFIPLDAPATDTGTHSILAGTETNNAAAELEQLRLKLKDLTENGPKRPMVMSVKEEEQITDSPIFLRGDIHSPGQRVPRGFLKAASHGEVPVIPANQSGRVQLAQWLSSPQNPLTARVYANRVWLWLFGNGIVRTPDNFGTTGSNPTHPELLDYLAATFVKEGWSTKKLVRELVLSRVYRMSTEATPGQLESDPENRLFSRANLRRIDAEALRDTILQVSGNLDLTVGGPTIKPGTASDYGYVDNEDRRGIYVPAFRNALPKLFELFDFADPSVVTGQRNQSTVAPQALYFMNHPWVMEHAQLAAERILAEVSGNLSDKVVALYRRTLGRPPSSRELQIALNHLAGGEAELPAWTELAQALFASVDFRYLN